MGSIAKKKKKVWVHLNTGLTITHISLTKYSSLVLISSCATEKAPEEFN